MGLDDSAGLLFRIRTDGSQAKQGLDEFRKEFKKTTDDLQGFGSKWSQAFQGFTREIGLTGSEAAVMQQNFKDLTGFMSGYFNALTTLSAGAVTAFAAVGAATVAAGVAIFGLAKQASDFGSALYDAQQKTNLSASQLYALKLAAEQSGSSFQQVTTSVAHFAELLGHAKQGNEKAIETLQRYGITTLDLNKALDQAITKIQNEADETLQAAASKDLFRDKTANLVPVFRQLGTSLDDNVKKLEKLGETLTETDIRAADDFGDTLKELEEQSKSLASQFALQFAPVITEAMKAVSRSLADNRDEIRRYGQNFADVLRGMESVAQSSTVSMVGSFVAWAAKVVAQIDIVQLAIIQTINLLARLGQKTGSGLGTVAGQTLGHHDEGAAEGAEGPILGAELPGGGGKGGGGKSAKDNTEAERKKALQAEEKDNQERLASYRAFLDREQAALEVQLAEKLLKEDEYLRQSNDLKLKALLFEKQLNDNVLQNFDLTEKERHEIEVKNQVIEYELEKETLDLTKQVIEEKKKETAEEEKQFKQREKERKAARDEANRKANERARTEVDPTGNKQRNKQLQNSLGLSILGDSILSVRNQMGDLENTLKPSFVLFQDLGAMVGQAAQAFGQLLNQMILTGDAGPHAVRKLVASVIASFAQAAAVQALMELAYGFAALTPWGAAIYGPAPLHFKAAALLGAAAAAASVIGRGIAGDAFKDQTATATGGSTSQSSQHTAGGGGVYSSQQPTTVEQGRNTPARSLGTLHIKLGMEKDGVAKVIDHDFRTNGRIRGLVIDVAAAGA